MPTIHAVNTTGHDITTIDWTGDGQPLWISVRPNLRRIHVLAGDILQALGKRRDVGGRGRNQSVDVKLATACLAAHHVPALVVVDAQRLDPRIPKSLVTLTTNADADLWLLHRPPHTDSFLNALDRRCHDEQPLDTVPTPAASPPTAPPAVHDLPAVPPHDFHVFAAVVDQALAPDAAAAVLDELRGHARSVADDLEHAADPAATVADALVRVLHDAPPDNLLITRTRAIQISTRTLRRRFPEAVSRTWREYLQHARLFRAMALLSAPGPSVRDVALRVGFDSPSAFARAFQGWTGERPTSYRQRWRAGGGTPEGDHR